MIHDWIAQMPPPRQFVKAWATDDLANELHQLKRRRMYSTGSQLFKELGCAQCHRFAGGGGGAGPDLSGISQKRSALELLESIIEPSKHIAPEFASTIIVTTEGQSLEGRIVQENEQKLVLRTVDSLAAPLVVLKDEIDERHLSTTSTMPSGLLDRLQKSEILDLLAYVIANADPQHSSYGE